MSRYIGVRRKRTNVYAPWKKKSRHNSPAPWEFPLPNTSWPLTPRRHYLKSIRLLQPQRNIPRDNPTTWFGLISGGSGEWGNLLHCNFCYKKSTPRHEGREWNMFKVNSFFNMNSIIQSFYIIASSKSRAVTSSNCSKGDCLSWASWGISVQEFGMT